MASTALKIALLLTANTSRANRDINALTKNATKKLEALKKAATWDSIGNKQLTQGALMAAPLLGAIKLASDLEDKIADVAKVTGTEFGSKEFKGFEQSAMRIGAELGRSSVEVATLMAELAAGGVAKEDLNDIALMAGKVGVAFDISAGEAGKAFMQIQNGLGTTSKDTELVMDAMNAATNKFGGKASYLLDFMASGGASVSQSLKVSGVKMQAFGNAMQNVGIESSEAATTMERFQKAILTNSKVAAIFNKAGGGSAGMVAILKQAQASGNAAQWLLNNDFGEYSSKLAQMANNMNSEKGLLAQLNHLDVRSNVEGSVDKEYEDRQKTTTEQFKKLKVNVSNVAVSLGSVLLPVVNDLIKKTMPYVEMIQKWISDNQELTGTILKTAAALVVGKLAFGGMAKGVSSIVKAFNGLKKGYSIVKNVASATKRFYQVLRLSSAINAFARGGSIITRVFGFIQKGAGIAKVAFGFLGKAVLWVGRLFIANPIIAGIVGIATAAYLIYKHWEPIKKWFSDLWDGVKNSFTKAFEHIKSKLMVVKDIISNPLKAAWDLGNKVGTTIKESFSDSGPSPSPIPLKSSVAFSPTITVNGGATQADAQLVSDAVYKQFEQFQKRYNHNQTRRSLA